MTRVQDVIRDLTSSHYCNLVTLSCVAWLEQREEYAFVRKQNSPVFVGTVRGPP